MSTAQETALPTQPTAAEHRAWLANFGEQYHYNVGYMEALLDASPAAFEAFLAGTGMANQRAHLSPEVYHVGVISALIADDCGECSQLGLLLALEEGVERDLLQTLLDAPDRLAAPLDLVSQYASEVARGNNASLETIAKLKSALGDRAFGELATSVLGVQLYPALRRALGKEVECLPPSLPPEEQAASNSEVFTTRSVVEGTERAVVWKRDLDGAWQLLPAQGIDLESAMLISLDNAFAIDPGLSKLADLPLGGVAELDSTGAWAVR